MIGLSEYPLDYNHLSKEFQDKTLEWFTDHRKALQRAREMQSNFVPEISKRGIEWERALTAEIHTVKDYLSKVGIKIEYGWAGHRGEWFFATYEDAEMEEDWIFQCTDYDEC